MVDRAIARVVARVVLIDDHEVVRLAIGSLIDGCPELQLVGSAATVAEVLRAGVDFDLAVLDLSLRDGSTPTANVQAIRATGANVVVLTSGDNPYLMREIARSEALAILRKSLPADAILAAVRDAAVGRVVTTFDWAATVHGDPTIAEALLSPRERAVLSLYASGLGAKAVAAELGITENTVDDHIRRIRSEYGRLGRTAHSKTHMLLRAIEDGFVPVPGVNQ